MTTEIKTSESRWTKRQGRERGRNSEIQEIAEWGGCDDWVRKRGDEFRLTDFFSWSWSLSWYVLHRIEYTDAYLVDRIYLFVRFVFFSLLASREWRYLLLVESQNVPE